MIGILIRCSFIAEKYTLYTLLFLEQYFCAMLCVYAFKQLVGENEIYYHLSAQN